MKTQPQTINLDKKITDKNELSYLCSHDSISGRLLVVETALDEICSKVDEMFYEERFDNNIPEWKIFVDFKARIEAIHEAFDEMEFMMDNVPGGVEMPYLNEQYEYGGE